MDLKLRNATLSDSTMLLAWRNSPEARKYSPNTEKISLKSHEEWFNQRIRRAVNEPFWIVERSEKPVGFIRLDLKTVSDEVFVISIFIDKDFRGEGLGQSALQLMKDSLKPLSTSRILARVHEKNTASKLLFEKCGFTLFDKSLDYFEYELVQ